MIPETTLLDQVCETVVAGGTICLLGAGFSLSGQSVHGAPLPTTQELTKDIFSAIGISAQPGASLADVADYCEDDPASSLALRKLLIDRLTLCKPSDLQRKLIAQPWRSIFTTNFDDLIERCIGSASQQIITPSTNSIARNPGATPIYYMHGRAKDLAEGNIDPKFVISERNYLRLHEDNRSLYAQLQNEIFAAKYIVVLGYSLRDLDVARIFLEAGHAFKEKTIIITSDNEDKFLQSRLKKFGTVFPIGISGFVEVLERQKVSEAFSRPYSFVDVTEDLQPAEEVGVEDFVRLIITGRFEGRFYKRQLLSRDRSGDAYAIRRSSVIEAVLGRPKDGVNRFVISSDLGNGKSVFLKQLAVELGAAGYKVVEVSSEAEEVFEELDRLLTEVQPLAFLMDDVIRYRSVAEYIGKRLNGISLFVCCVRGDLNEIVNKDLSNRLGGAARQIDTNKLGSSEIEQWDAALERWGLWEGRIALSREERLSFLANECASENRSIILSLFRSSRIAEKINQIVDFFLKSGGYQKEFAALLISALCQQHVTWESIVFWLEIDEQQLKADLQNNELSGLFFDGRTWNIVTSPQLADYVLRTKYIDQDKDTLVDVYSTIVQRTADSAADLRAGYVFRENLKELMKFRFLTRLFGDNEDGVKLISRVYKRLSSAPYIRDNPQFWLQYAMSRMQVDDLSSAETYLNTALGKAAQRGMSYSPFQILDQRARLYFIKNARKRGRFSVNEVKQAINDLRESIGNPESEMIYLYRSAPLILDFVEARIDELDVALRQDLKDLLKKFKQVGEDYQRLPRSQKGETDMLRKALNSALRVLEYG